MRSKPRTLAAIGTSAVIVAAIACSASSGTSGESTSGNNSSSGASSGDNIVGGGSNGIFGGGSNGAMPYGDDASSCPTKESLQAGGYECGKIPPPRECGGGVVDLGACGAGKFCQGGINNMPTRCVTAGAGGGGACDVCDAIPTTCNGDAGGLTTLSGRVITPGRNDGDTANQVGVPNAIVYITQSANVTLPALAQGIPATGDACDRCTEQTQNLGGVLAGAVSGPNGEWTITGKIPVNKEFLLVVKAGKFRRAVKIGNAQQPVATPCGTNALPTAAAANPTRLPRTMSDGLFVNIPRIAISTGDYDSMECVFRKMGIDAGEFGDGANPATDAKRVHLYQGGSGATYDGNSPGEATLYGDFDRLRLYDMVVSDCKGPSWDSSGTQRAANGSKIVQYVDHGGRFFASHLSFSWLNGNGSLAGAATWNTSADTETTTSTGNVPPYPPVGGSHTRASPRTPNFLTWLRSNGVITSPTGTTWSSISEPKNQVSSLNANTEEFVYATSANKGTQQFSFSAPYSSSADAGAATACGRVAYSGFHVAEHGAGQAFNATTNNYCTGGNANNGVLTSQEKVLLYMLFDVAACVGPDPIGGGGGTFECAPTSPTCPVGACGEVPVGDGCGNVIALQCGDCGGPN